MQCLTACAPARTRVHHHHACIPAYELHSTAYKKHVQAIADEQTMPETRRQLLERLIEVSGVARVHASLRSLAAAAPTAQTRASKRELWADLRDRTLWLAAAAVWLLPAITLLVHVQVVVLGRHMYLERMTAGADDDVSPAAAVAGALGVLGRKAAGAPKLWALSGAQQEAFMSYSAFLLHDGLLQLLPATMPLVQAASGAHAPQAPTTVAAVRPAAAHASVLLSSMAAPRIGADCLGVRL